MVALGKKKATAARTPGQVWDVFDWLDRRLAGYLVTLPGDVDGVVAYVNAEEQSRTHALELAERIAADFATLDHPAAWGIDDDELCHDLRGRGDADHPMPRWVYGLRCRPHPDNGRSLSVQPSPHCPWLFQGMALHYRGDDAIASNRADAVIDAAMTPIIEQLVDMVATLDTDAGEAKDRRGASGPRRKTAGAEKRPSGPQAFPFNRQSEREEKAVSRTGELVA